MVYTLFHSCIICNNISNFKQKKKIKKMKDKINIEISKINQANLDALRREIVEIISRINDLELMKKVEKCSYDKLILLLNIGFSEKAFYETLNGNLNLHPEDVVFTDKSKDVLIQLLKEDIEENINKQSGGLK